MKTKLILALVMLALSAHAATTVKTEYFELADSVRLFDVDGDSDSPGYKYAKHVTAHWPVAVNGKYSKALSSYLLDSLFNVYKHPNIFPYYPGELDVMAGFLGDVIYRDTRDNTLVEDYVKKEPLAVGDLNCEEYPLNCWYDNIDIKLSHTLGDLVFYTANYDIYLGGAHGMFFTDYLVFDARLDKPVHLKDFVTSPAKLLRLLPSYDKRDKDTKWWENIEVENIDNFYIKNGKMVFVFAPYAIGPFCDGIIEVPVPIKTLRAKGLLTAYAKQKLK